MDKEFFIKLAIISWAGWLLHPGYLKSDGPEPPSLAKLVRLAEELWALSQQH